jgi:hypothetical protein
LSAKYICAVYAALINNLHFKTPYQAREYFSVVGTLRVGVFNDAVLSAKAVLYTLKKECGPHIFTTQELFCMNLKARHNLI